ncbi:Kinesin-like protein KIF6 [Chlorella vulgaris]
MEAADARLPELNQQRIAVYLRLRPVPRPSGRVLTGAEDGWVEFNVPKDTSQGLINNSRESYRFAFDGLLPPAAGQAEVFERVALPVLHSALDGYNGTVFAFGQTGSGKTFTISGGTERYADRGLIPRALSTLFSEAARRTDHTWVVHVSYMEIYCESGFDLLEPNREVQALEDLPKDASRAANWRQCMGWSPVCVGKRIYPLLLTQVHVLEDDDARLHIRNLSLHRCDTEEQALNMLFLGDTNRVVAETPLNLASSRSHCVFTVHIEARRSGEAVVRRSKLNFVDLAGSERVVKTGMSASMQLREAKYINLSLHFLEQVIISLHEKRLHVPYRNSMLTQVLRDSLGGNTRTVMVAAVAPESQHIEESISTCRFAQRVAMITNRVTVNEELDLEVVVKQLKQENALLRQELQLLRSVEEGGDTTDAPVASLPAPEGSGQPGQGQAQPMSEGEQQALWRRVQAYVDDQSPDARLDVQASMPAVHEAFAMLRSLARGDGCTKVGGSLQPATGNHAHGLRQLVQQQQHQIAVLAGVLHKQGHGTKQQQQQQAEGSLVTGGALPLPPPLPPHSEALVADQHTAFEYFCAQSPAHDAVAERKAALRARYDDAQALGAAVTASKQRIADLKATVERRRLAQSMAVLLRQQAGAAVPDGNEEKGVYREACGALRSIKAEVEGMQAMLGRARARLQRDFQAWYAVMSRCDHEAGAEGAGATAAGTLQQQQQLEDGERLAGAERQQIGVPATSLQLASSQPKQQQQEQQQQRQSEWTIAAEGSNAGRGDGAPQPPAALPSFSSWRSAPALFTFDQRGGLGKAASSETSHVADVQPQPAHRQQQQQQQQQQQPQPHLQEGAAAPDPCAGVDAEVLAAARPLLTGNLEADTDIIKFYQARQALLRSMR